MNGLKAAEPLKRSLIKRICKGVLGFHFYYHLRFTFVNLLHQVYMFARVRGRGCPFHQVHSSLLTVLEDTSHHPSVDHHPQRTC
jgi:hypothetical protein